MEPPRAKVIGVARHRLATDGDGVTTLVAFHGSPLHCRYCLNPQSLGDGDRFKEYTPESLYREVSIDELYFLATNGGVTFGGGSRVLRPDFIRHFRETVRRELANQSWKPRSMFRWTISRPLLPVVNTFIIDIKDLNPEIYRSYTRQDNSIVLANLRLVADSGRQEDCIIRIPLIPEFNTDADRYASRAALEQLGFTRFDLFTYQIRKH